MGKLMSYAVRSKRMNRREFSGIVAGSMISVLFPPSFPLDHQRPEDVSVSENAARLYQQALIVDCNSGPAGGGYIASVAD
jgi:hypothetical protein